jgi:hypothetical protein
LPPKKLPGFAPEHVVAERAVGAIEVIAERRRRERAPAAHGGERDEKHEDAKRMLKKCHASFYFDGISVPWKSGFYRLRGLQG